MITAAGPGPVQSWEPGALMGAGLQELGSSLYAFLGWHGAGSEVEQSGQELGVRIGC